MNNQDEHDDNYFRGHIGGGGASMPDDAPFIDGGGASMPDDAPIFSGGNAFTRDMKESNLAVADGFGFPKGLPTSIKLKLHTLLDEHGITPDNLTEKASELAAQIKPMLEQGYDFVVNHVEALVDQVKTDAAKYLEKKNQK